MGHLDLRAALRGGDASAWQRLRPGRLAESDALDAWTASLGRRGRPGSPPTLNVYTHFTYCVSSCSFCMYWHQVPRDPRKYASYADYLIQRLSLLRERVGRVRASNAYFGGGTPSAMPADQLERYLDSVLANVQRRGRVQL